jgi:micrococcal nuclease
MTSRRLLTILFLIVSAIGCAGGSGPTPTLFFAPDTPSATPIFGTIPPPSPTPVSDTTSMGVPVTLPPNAEYASVTFVIDGDTIDVSMGGETFRVRYTSINTPERDEPCYEEATASNRALVEDQIVVLIPDVSDTDQHGRLLRYVYVGDVFVNAKLVSDGWAEARRYEPDVAHYDAFDRLEAQAFAQNLGCWSTGVFER